MGYDYYCGMEIGQSAFIRIPRMLIRDERFAGLSSNAKLLYGLMLDRLNLSIKNGWIDEENRPYINYTLESIIEDLNCSKSTCVRILSELDNKKGIGLIERKHQGLGRPDRIYVKNFASFEEKPGDSEGNGDGGGQGTDPSGSSEGNAFGSEDGQSGSSFTGCSGSEEGHLLYCREDGSEKHFREVDGGMTDREAIGGKKYKLSEMSDIAPGIFLCRGSCKEDDFEKARIENPGDVDLSFMKMDTFTDDPGLTDFCWDEILENQRIFEMETQEFSTSVSNYTNNNYTEYNNNLIYPINPIHQEKIDELSELRMDGYEEIESTTFDHSYPIYQEEQEISFTRMGIGYGRMDRIDLEPSCPDDGEGQEVRTSLSGIGYGDMDWDRIRPEPSYPVYEENPELSSYHSGNGCGEMDRNQNSSELRPLHREELEEDQDIRASPGKLLQKIRENIEREYYLKNLSMEERAIFDEIDRILMDVAYARGGTFRISGVEYPPEYVRERALELNSNHICYILECMKYRTNVRNPRAYMLTTVFNSLETMDHSYQQQMYCDGWGM